VPVADDNAPGAGAEIAWYGDGREQLRDLFALADDSPEQVDRYLELRRVLVAVTGQSIVGLAQLLDCDTPADIQLRSLAVVGRLRRRGLGRVLVEHAAADCRDRGARRLLVATAAADTGNLRFYQLLGFRMQRVERDAFSSAGGYADGLEIDGIRLRDRVWLTLAL
jgi:GNAT superfamily N-acetyltransferase